MEFIYRGRKINGNREKQRHRGICNREKEKERERVILIGIDREIETKRRKSKGQRVRKTWKLYMYILFKP